MLYPQTQQNKFVNWQGDAEFRGEDFTATVTLGNPDVLVGSGRSSVTDAVQVTVTVVCSFKLVKSSYVVRQKQNCDLHLSSSCCRAPVRYRRRTLPPVHNAGSGSGRGAGLSPQAWRGGLSNVFSWQIHR